MSTIRVHKVWISAQRKLSVNCKHQAKVVKMEMMASGEGRPEGKRKRRGVLSEQGPGRNSSLQGHSGGQWICLERRTFAGKRL